MKNYHFRTVTDQDIPSMALLLMGRQERESKHFPFLKNSSLQKEKVESQLQNLLTNSSALGMGAFLHDQLVGYLVGMIRDLY